MNRLPLEPRRYAFRQRLAPVFRVQVRPVNTDELLPVAFGLNARTTRNCSEETFGLDKINLTSELCNYEYTCFSRALYPKSVYL